LKEGYQIYGELKCAVKDKSMVITLAKPKVDSKSDKLKSYTSYCVVVSDDYDSRLNYFSEKINSYRSKQEYVLLRDLDDYIILPVSDFHIHSRQSSGALRPSMLPSDARKARIETSEGCSYYIHVLVKY